MATKAQVVELQNRIDELQHLLEQVQSKHEEELTRVKAQVEQETLHAYKGKVISLLGDEIKELIEQEIKENLKLKDEENYYGLDNEDNNIGLTLVYKKNILGSCNIFQ
jgi:hypothetical protein